MSWSDSNLSNNRTPTGGDTSDHSIFMILVLGLSALFFGSFFLQILLSIVEPGSEIQDRVSPTHLFNQEAHSQPCDR